MNQVLVIDTNREPQQPVYPGEARIMLIEGAVWRRFPFTIILQGAAPNKESAPQLHLKLDPGSSTTGTAIVDYVTGSVIWVAELEHRGESIKMSLISCGAIRRSRRSRKTRHRPARFDHSGRPVGWLPPSVRSRLANIIT